MTKTKKIKIKDKEIYAKQFGTSSDVSKPTLVFLHDALGCIASWKSFPEKLCNELEMNGLMFDRIGHGLSSTSTTNRNVDYLEKEALNVLPKVLEEIGIHKPILIGSSDGGSIALVYAAKFPTKALVSLAGHSKVEPITLQGIREAVEILEKPPLFQKLEGLHGVKAKKLLYDWADTWLSPLYKYWNIDAYLPQIDCPVLILQGKEDQYATDQHAIAIAKKITSPSTYKIMEDCGHFPHLEQPELVITQIKNFLTREK